MIAGCSGDVGDAIYCIGVLSGLDGGPHALVFHPSDATKFRTWEAIARLSQLIAPLALQQSYISECRVAGQGEAIQWRSGEFRGRGIWCPRATLLEAKAHHLQMIHNIGHGIRGTNKWINVAPDTRTNGRIVISRTGRYRNGYFPWQEIVDHYGDRLVFIGLPHEYRDFCGEFGGVEWLRTDNMLDVAKLVAGSELCIANQSSVNACAEGLKHNLIQETSIYVPDCIFRRGNAQHVSDGSCILPNVSDSGHIHIPTKFRESISNKTHITPPGLWRYPNVPNNPSLAGVVNEVHLRERRRRPKEEIELEVVAFNIRRNPEHFTDKSSRCIFDIFHEALSNSPA